MNISQLLIATACSLTVIGASGVAFAQTTSPATSNSGTQSQGQTSDRTSNTTAPGNTNSTATGTNTTGSRMGQSPADTITNNAGDGSTMRTERLARADRN